MAGLQGRARQRCQATAEAEVATELLDDEDFVEEEYVPSEADGGMFGDVPAKKAKEFWPSAKRLMGLLKPESVGVYIVIGLVIVSVVLNVIAPKVLGTAMDVIFGGVIGRQVPPEGVSQEQFVELMRQQGQGNFADMVSKMELTNGIDFPPKLTFLISIVLLMYFVANIFLWAQGWLLNRIVMRVIKKLRNDVQAKLNRLPLNYFDTRQRGDILSRVTNDVDNVQQGLQQAFSQLVSSVLTVLGITVMMFIVSWELALIALIALPLSGIVAGVIGARSQKLFAAQWKNTGALNGQIEESFSGHDLVKVFGRDADMLERFDEKNEELYKASFGAQFVSGVIFPAMNFVSYLSYVASPWWAASALPQAP